MQLQTSIPAVSLTNCGDQVERPAPLRWHAMRGLLRDDVQRHSLVARRTRTMERGAAGASCTGRRNSGRRTGVHQKFGYGVVKRRTKTNSMSPSTSGEKRVLDRFLERA